MTDKELRNILLSVTQPAVERQEEVKNQMMQKLPAHNCLRIRRRTHRLLAAAAVCILFLSIVTITTSDSAMAATVRESISAVIEKIFPPREISITPEGLEENIIHTPHSNIPDESSDNPGQPEESLSAETEMPENAIPQYVIYVDDSAYYSSEENGVIEIKPISAGNSLPVECKIAITYLPDISLEEAALNRHKELESLYSSVSEITDSLQPAGLYISCSDGTAWNSPVCETYFVDSGQDGVFLISSQYFMEAAEGHGTRFASMIATFEVIPAYPAY